jgi:hypothetical protein
VPPRQVLASTVPGGLTDLGVDAGTGEVERSSLSICRLTTPNGSATSRLSRQVARVDDFIARMADTQAWQDLVAEVGEQQAREAAKQRLAAQDANSLINWQPDGPLH